MKYNQDFSRFVCCVCLCVCAHGKPLTKNSSLSLSFGCVSLSSIHIMLVQISLSIQLCLVHCTEENTLRWHERIIYSAQVSNIFWNKLINYNGKHSKSNRINLQHYRNKKIKIKSEFWFHHLQTKRNLEISGINQGWVHWPSGKGKITLPTNKISRVVKTSYFLLLRKLWVILCQSLLSH